MLQRIRDFADRVRSRRRLELAITVFCGLLGLAMGGTGRLAWQEHTYGPSHRPTEETRRLARIVIVHSISAREPRSRPTRKEALAAPAPRPAPPAPPLLPPLRRAAPVTTVRGPPAIA